MKRFFKKGQIVLFQGDSTTDCCRSRTDLTDLSEGYPGKVAQIYNTLFPENGVTFINRGVSGNRIRDLVARYEEDFKAMQPDFISIMIGINDTWRRYDSNDPTTAEAFEADYRILLTNIKTDLPNTKIMIIDPFVVHTLPERIAYHEDLDPKIQVARKMAVEFADYYLPLDGIFTSKVVEGYTPIEITEDGVHPSSLGHSILAEEYLKVLGIL